MVNINKYITALLHKAHRAGNLAYLDEDNDISVGVNKDNQNVSYSPERI